ncbi:hypothetical protein M8C21_015737 [Ambrosia artemisiifolia]|uniref:Auxin-responsive protein n=1 Tax=Ambrosia artemisiifolia TaxID=4212 RepID=A0AAD5CDZ9_AMBAR|nr:hypothetical protein M8C21_015737 [Ambrosia artemisiifolia]
MELELSLSPPNQTRHHIKKTATLTRFPLVSWNHDEDDQQPNGFFNGDYQQDHMNEDGEGLTGWPPLHSWRRRLMEENQYERVDDQFNRPVDEVGEHINVMNNNNNYNELFVKVKMEGVGIARKIDLNAFHSYEMLTTALIHMFDKSVEIEEDGASYKLMYQHRDGHWHLGGDLPWEMFIRSVKRIQMVRN